MLDLINTVIVASRDKSVDTTHVLSILKKMGASPKQVAYPELSDYCDEPIIYCSHSEDDQQTDALTTPYIHWQSNQPSKGIFFDTFDTTEQDESSSTGITLPLVDSLYALFQSHVRQHGLLSPDVKRLWHNAIIGNSIEFQSTIDLASRIAQIDCDVLIQGETGTGKEVIARLIHYQSEREEYPFVPINCGAFSDELLLSELFGHTKGAFTGATADRVGLIEQAENGTLFLDEIDSLSGKAQVALLRYLQDREVRPQGSNTLKVCDTRVVAASNKCLKKLVSEGKFREDLLFRLDVLHIDLPPLRERGNDIHLLTQYFMRKIAKQYNSQPKAFSPNMIKTMGAYEWPGNIRQLQNIVTRLFLLSDDFVIRVAGASKLAGVDWGKYLTPSDTRALESGMQKEKRRVVEAFELSYLREVLSATRGNVSKAAKISKKERRSFIRLMQKYQLNREDFVTH